MRFPHRLLVRACPVIWGRLGRGDFVLLRSVALPTGWLSTTILARHRHGSWVWRSEGMPFCRTSRFAFISSGQAETVLGFAKLNGLLNAASASCPAMDGYHLSVRMRMDGRRHRFHLSNVSLFTLHPTERILRQMETRLGRLLPAG